VVLVVFLLLLLEDFEVVVELLCVELVERFHLLVALLKVLNVVLHFDLGGRVGLHALHPQLLNCLLELLLLPSPALREGRLHVDVLLKALVHFALRLLDVGLPLSLESPLDLVQLLDALVPQSEVLLTHLAHQHFDVACLLLEGLRVLIVLLF
jgi:hypothetical protein